MNDIKNPLFEPFTGASGIDNCTIGATTVGNKKLRVDDFSKVRCPFCGDEMIISGYEASVDNIPDYIEKDIMHTHSCVDGIGQRHTYRYGRDRKEHTELITMRCMSGCVSEMKVPVTHITLSPYREFTELKTTTHYDSKY